MNARVKCSVDSQTASGKALTELVLEIFRLNGRLLSAGDQLVGDLRLTSARWQVLGAIALADAPQTVAGIARSMGLNRQGVQRIANETAAEGLVAFEPNPQHKRAQLVVLTRKGRAVFEAAADRQVPWANALAKGISTSDIDAETRLATVLRVRLSNET